MPGVGIWITDKEGRKEKIERDREREREMHRLRASLLSSENVDKPAGFRGVLNLVILLLVLTHVRLIIVNARKYGVLVDPRLMTGLLGSGDWYEWPATALLIGCQFNILIAFLIERAASSKSFTRCSDRFVLLANLLNISTSLLVSVIWIYFNSEHGSLNPAQGILTLLTTLVICMKLTSYSLTNMELRRSFRKGIDAPVECLGIDIEAERKKNEDLKILSYPNNLTITNLYSFIMFPTLVYCLQYPRTKRIRKGWLLRRCLELVSISIIVVSMSQQWVLPTVRNAKFDQLDIVHMAERVLKLAIPNMYVWLLGFYAFFHLYLNILAELTFFGDRLFCTFSLSLSPHFHFFHTSYICIYIPLYTDKDWWNSRSLDYFWSHWNLPVHHFMKRHVYVPLRKKKWSSVSAVLLIFFISGIGHEIVLSVPFGSVKLWAVFGMMAQAPLCALTRRSIFRSTQFGNIVFWLSIILGQPTLVLFYYYEYTH